MKKKNRQEKSDAHKTIETIVQVITAIGVIVSIILAIPQIGDIFRDFFHPEESDGVVDANRNGYHVVRYDDGSIYKGRYVNGYKNGYGRYYDSDGTVYKGSFKDGRCHGKGTVYDVRHFIFRSILKKGAWKEGVFIG